MEIMRISGNEYSDRPYSPDSKYSTKNIGFTTYGNFERENRNQNLQKLSSVEKKALMGQSFLGKRILC
jgi:hypothetical protein